MANNFFHKYPYTNFHELNLDWILDKITEFNTRLDNWQQLANELIAALGDIDTMKADILQLQSDVADLMALRADLSRLEAEVLTISTQSNSNSRDIAILKQQMSGLDNRFDDVYTRIKNEVTKLNQTIAAVTLEIQNDYNEKFYVIMRILDDLQQQLDAINTSLVNPWHSEMGKISPDANNKFVYADLADECLTAEEYLKLGLSASDYAAFNISAINYAKFGKTRLHFRYVFMPLEGVKQEISVALDSIVNNIMGTMTADDYAELDLDADDYAALDLTAAIYMRYPLNTIGLSADDYAGLGTLNSGLVFNFN